MRIILTSLFALALMGYVTVSSADSLQIDKTAEMRGAAGGEIYGGRGIAPRYAPGGEFRGGERGIAPGGEMRERGEHREFREGRHEGRDRHYEGSDIYVVPYGYYPSYEYEEPSETEPGYFYYCEDPAGYYPNVVVCNREWEVVPSDQEGE